MFLLKYGDKTEKEMAQRLKKKGYCEREIAKTMAFLLEYSFLDDARYAKGFVEASMEKGRGPLRIRQELREKGIPPSLADEAMEELYDEKTEQEIAQRVVEKALRAFQNQEQGEGACSLSEKDKMKILRRLASAGFSARISYDALRRL